MQCSFRPHISERSLQIVDLMRRTGRSSNLLPTEDDLYNSRVQKSDGQKRNKSRSPVNAAASAISRRKKEEMKRKSEIAAGDEKMRKIKNQQLLERMTQRQVIEAIAYAKTQNGQNKQNITETSSFNQNKVGYDIFFDVFYYLGTFSEAFSRNKYQDLNIRERLFAETLWSLLQRYSGLDQQFFTIDDTRFLQLLLSFYSPKSTSKDQAATNLLDSLLSLSSTARTIFTHDR